MDFITRFFGKKKEESTGAAGGESPHHDVRVATCALFLEMAGIDGEFNDEESTRIVALLESEFGLSHDDARSLTDHAHRELDGSLDLWQFTNLINENYSQDEKLQVLRLVWRVVYADGKLDAHEDYLVHKISKLLRLTHKHLITTKTEVLREVRG